MKLMVTILCLVALVTPVCATETTDDAENKKAVAEVVRTAVDGVLSVLKNEQLSEREKREKVMSIIEPVIDFRLMARLSLDKAQWRRQSKEQRKSFTDLFVEDLRRSYFEKLTLFTDEKVEFDEPVRKTTNKKKKKKKKKKKEGTPKYSVLSYIISKGERIQVSYSLALRTGAPPPAASGDVARPTGGTAKEEDVSMDKPVAREDETGNRTWRIYDLKIEGISIPRTKRADYRDFLSDGNSFDDLLAEMRKKVEAAKAKNAESEKEK